MEEETWLSSLVEGFTRCRSQLQGNEELGLGTYIDACSKIEYGLCQLGPVFKFASSDLTNKCSTLKRASQEDPHLTIQSAIESDLGVGRATAGNSNSRNLHRVTNAVKFIHLLLKSLLEDSEQPLRVAAHKAYMGSIEYYLAWAPKQAVKAGLYLLPSKEKFLQKIGETEDSVRELAEKLVDVIEPVLERIYGIYKTLHIDL